MDTLKSFMSEHGLDNVLRLELRKFFVHASRVCNADANFELISYMSPTLQEKVSFQLHSTRIEKVSYFCVKTAGKVSEETGRFVSHVGLRLHFRCFNIGDTIITKGHVADNMYVCAATRE
jgi:hypothetical protein